MTHTLRPSPTALLNPRCDASFKAMFTADTKESNEALKDFISTVLDRPVKEIQLSQNEPPVEIITQAQMSFDVSVKFNDGEKIDLEMQSRQQNYDYGSRAEIQVARLLSTSNSRGDRWNTPSAYQISVLNFEFDKDDNSPLSWYTMKKENGKRLADKLNVIFFDLVKIHRKLGKPVESLTKLDKWGLFLSYADDERQKEYIERIIKGEGGLMSAKSSLLTVSQDEINWARQNSIFIAEQDHAAIVYNAEKQGMERGMKQGLEQGMKQGMKQGLEQGIEQGERKAKEEAARNLIKLGLPYEQISQVLSLPLEDIKALS
ncbi:MAG: Rpn family recombination-promoting nuclease/putative transposase [Treponema sp.]|nr:Rpn family recombination-promoting nuclease/putative transposase [Treponema sp.]